MSFCNPNEVSSLEGFEIRYAEAAINAGDWYVPPLGDVYLSRGVFRDNENALVARVPYATINADNCLIVNNLHAIRGRNTAEITLRNCTIANNISTNEGKYAIFNFENCIFAFNGDTFASDVTSPTDMLVHNCLFEGVDANKIMSIFGETVFYENGNRMGDPLFVDRGAGNYQLGAGSPAIDAGLGGVASAQDLLGHGRYDDRGMPNTGRGSPCYVDMGAFERQQDTASPDLAVIYVSDPAPEFVAAGESFTVQWTVSNVGLLPTPTSWQDIIYISTDPYLSSNDQLLQRQNHSGILQSGAGYTGTFSGVAPQIPGVYYLLVRTNAEQTFTEPIIVNNLLA